MCVPCGNCRTLFHETSISPVPVRYRGFTSTFDRVDNLLFFLFWAKEDKTCKLLVIEGGGKVGIAGKKEWRLEEPRPGKVRPRQEGSKGEHVWAEEVAGSGCSHAC